MDACGGLPSSEGWYTTTVPSVQSSRFLPNAAVSCPSPAKRRLYRCRKAVSVALLPFSVSNRAFSRLERLLTLLGVYSCSPCSLGKACTVASSGTGPSTNRVMLNRLPVRMPSCPAFSRMSALIMASSVRVKRPPS